ncbi:MAG TPA: response regulator transcription factor [Acidimicrobiales bacterium]|nr:response regulator transcription factor [Acidimicrobiales bacterium]
MTAIGAGTTTDGERIRLLVVEDEESFVEALRLTLEREGFALTVARDGLEALAAFEQSEPDLVLLDVMLPKLSGIDVCRTIRSRSSVPIIMVSAKSAEIDTVIGLEVGADDYVAKPYRMRELISRMRAVLRRRDRGGADELDKVAPLDDDYDESTEISGVRLDVQRHECFVRGAEVRLTRKEFDVLELLISNAGRLVTRDTLIDRVWGTDYVGDTKTLDVHIKRLRARIEEDPSHPTLITTIRGLGYRFERPRTPA